MSCFSTKDSPAEWNYTIYDKEIRAIICAFKHWHAERQSAENPIQILSNSNNLEYFMTSQLLNLHKARLATFRSQFNLKIMYRPRK